MSVKLVQLFRSEKTQRVVKRVIFNNQVPLKRINRRVKKSHPNQPNPTHTTLDQRPTNTIFHSHIPIISPFPSSTSSHSLFLSPPLSPLFHSLLYLYLKVTTHPPFTSPFPISSSYFEPQRVSPSSSFSLTRSLFSHSQIWYVLHFFVFWVLFEVFLYF